MISVKTIGSSSIIKIGRHISMQLYLYKLLNKNTANRTKYMVISHMHQNVEVHRQLTFLPSLSFCLTICPKVGCRWKENKWMINSTKNKPMYNSNVDRKRFIYLYWLKELINNILCSRIF